MLNWNEIFSWLGLAVAGFAYAFTVCFIFFVKALFWDKVIAIAGALVGTIVAYWALTSALFGLGILGLVFLSQAVAIGFLGGFLPEGMFAGSLLWAGTLALGITSRYTSFSQGKTLLIFVAFMVLFIPVWATDFLRRQGN